ncbi:MAG: PAS domain S-box protein, partial [Bacillota bacterium]
MEPPKRASAKASAFTFTLLYVVIAGLWMTASTPVMLYFFSHATPKQLWLLEISKGWFFLAVMATIIYTLIYRRLTTLLASQEAIRLSEQRYRQLVKTAQEGVWVLDAHEKTTFVNDKMAELLGYSPQEMLNHPLDRFMDADSFQLVMGDIGCSRQGLRQRRDLRLRRKEGTDLWTIISYMPIQDDQGQYAGVLVTVTDITARKQAETQLAEAEAKYRALVENSHVGVYILQDGRTVYINPRITEMLGYTPQDICGQPTLDIVVPEDRARIGARLGRRISGEEQANVPYSFGVIHRDGHRVDVEVLGSRMLYQGRPAIIGSMLDVSDRNRAEEALRQSEMRFRGIYEKSPIGIGLYDVNGYLVDANQASLEIFGVSRIEQARGHSIFADPNSPPEVLDAI